MSSHHFVRDRQEPTLLVANGDACSQDLLTSLLEWCPYILALDGAYDRLRALNIAVDAVLGDFDSVRSVDAVLGDLDGVRSSDAVLGDLDGVRSSDAVLGDFDNVRSSDAVLGDFDSVRSISPTKGAPAPAAGKPEVLFRPDPDKTDLQKGLDFLIERGHPSAHIIWASGGRSDHFLTHFSILAEYGRRITLNMIDDHCRTFLLPLVFRKWYAAGTQLSLMPMGLAEGIVTHNLVYPLHGESLEMGGRIGCSNEVASDGWVEVRYSSGALLMMEVFSQASAAIKG
ncbi:MAG: thiamine diphosphokinase [Bacteroidetes bacterium]|nr:thiamine diphosphokinase [Bacteroidota bacterium]